MFLECIDKQRIARILYEISGHINRLTEIMVVVLIVLMTLDVGVGVFFRYVIGNPLSWTEELARYLMIWAGLLAVAVCVARREHIGFSLIIDRVPSSFRRYFVLAFDGLVFCFFAVLLFHGTSLMDAGLKQRTMSLGVSMVLPYASVPVTAVIAMAQSVLIGTGDVLDATSRFPSSP